MLDELHDAQSLGRSMGINTVKTGDILSFSAGNPVDGGLSYRTVPKGPDKVGQALAGNPALAAVIAGRLPMIVGCYPAFLGFFPSAIFVDTYLRPSVFERALRLAANEALAPILVSQPLIIADLLRRGAAAVSLHARPLIVAMGGYACPWGLEQHLQTLLPEGSVILHGYGMAEVGFACLLGTRQACGQVVYRLVDPDVEVLVDEDRLGFAKIVGGVKQVWSTGDRVSVGNGLYKIQPGIKRVSDEVWRELESWGDDQWSRRTGHLARHGDGWAFQLRPGESRQTDTEVDFYDYARDHGMTWFDKPTWSI